MQVGDTDILVIDVENADGTAATYADKTAFTAAGGNLIWYDNAGVALVSQPTWDLEASSGKRHQFSFVVPAGVFTIKVEPPTGDVCNPDEFTGEGENYDLDAIGSRLASSGAVSISGLTNTGAAEIFDGDSILIEGITIPEAALSAVAAASLAACDHIRAFIKLNTADANDAPTVDYTALTVTVTSDTSGNRVVKVTADAFPAALGIPDDANTVAATLQVRLTEGTKSVTAASIALTIRWPAKQGTATP